MKHAAKVCCTQQQKAAKSCKIKSQTFRIDLFFPVPLFIEVFDQQERNLPPANCHCQLPYYFE